MTDTIDNEQRFDPAELVKASFPNLRCLRCRHDQFYVTDSPLSAASTKFRELLGTSVAEGGMGAVVTLACRRCGHVEQHLTDLLQQASKPIIE